MTITWTCELGELATAELDATNLGQCKDHGIVVQLIPQLTKNKVETALNAKRSGWTFQHGRATAPDGREWDGAEAHDVRLL